MSTATEEKVTEFVKTLTDLKAAKESMGGDVRELKSGMDAVKLALLGIQQSQEAAARAQVEQRAGGEDEGAYYVVKNDAPNVMPLGVDDRERVLVPKQGSQGVRLRGYFERHTIGDEIVPVWRWGLLDDPNPRTKAQLHAQQALTRRNVARMVGRKSKHSPQADLELFDALRALSPSIAKIFADSSGIGAPWIPDTTLPELERRILVETNLASIFPRRVIPPGGTTYLPTLDSDIRMYKGAVPTSNNPADAIISNLTMSSVNFDTVPLVGAVQADRDALADSVLPFASILVDRFSQAVRFATDDCILHGDTAASHQDAIASWNTRSRLGGTTGLGTTADHRRRWLGLVPRAFDLTSMTTDQNAAQTWDGLRVALGKLSADSMIEGYGSQGNVVVLTSWEYFFSKMLDFDEFVSFDKVGALATVLTGQLGDMVLGSQRVGGLLPLQVGFVAGFIPVCVAYPLTGDLAATGLYTGSGSTTCMVQTDRSRFEYVVRQGATLEAVEMPLNNTMTWVLRQRDTFRARDAVASTVKDTHYSFNLTY